MQNSRFKACLAAALLLLAIAPVAHALTQVDAEARYWLRTGETVSTYPVLLDNASYYILKISGNESVVFDSELQAVTDPQLLRQVVSTYVQNSLLSPDYIARLNSTVADFRVNVDNVLPTFFGCNSYYLQSTESYTYTLYRVNDPATRNAAEKANASRLMILGPILLMNSSMFAAEAALPRRDFDIVANSLATVSSQASIVWSKADQFSFDYESFMHDTCYMNKSALEFLANAGPRVAQVPAVSRIVQTVIEQTADRNASYIAKKLIGSRGEQLAVLGALKDRLIDRYKTAGGITLTVLNNLFADANSQLTTVAANPGGNISLEGVDARITTLNTTLTTYNRLFADYNKTAVNFRAATLELAVAKKRLGPNDDFYKQLEKQYNDVQAGINTANTALLANRDLDKTNLSDLYNKTVTLRARLASAQPAEQRLDIVVIIAIVLVIVAIVALVVWKRRTGPLKGVPRVIELRPARPPAGGVNKKF